MSLGALGESKGMNGSRNGGLASSRSLISFHLCFTTSQRLHISIPHLARTAKCIFLKHFLQHVACLSKQLQQLPTISRKKLASLPRGPENVLTLLSHRTSSSYHSSTHHSLQSTKPGSSLPERGGSSAPTHTTRAAKEQAARFSTPETLPTFK